MAVVAEVLLSLDNFDDPRYSRNRHVLTSPRSIRACHITGVAPRQLLKQPLSLFDNGDGYANAYHRQQVQPRHSFGADTSLTSAASATGRAATAAADHGQA